MMSLRLVKEILLIFFIGLVIIALFFLEQFLIKPTFEISDQNTLNEYLVNAPNPEVIISDEKYESLQEEIDKKFHKTELLAQTVDDLDSRFIKMTQFMTVLDDIQEGLFRTKKLYIQTNSIDTFETGLVTFSQKLKDKRWRKLTTLAKDYQIEWFNIKSNLFKRRINSYGRWDKILQKMENVTLGSRLSEKNIEMVLKMIFNLRVKGKHLNGLFQESNRYLSKLEKIKIHTKHLEDQVKIINQSVNMTNKVRTSWSFLFRMVLSLLALFFMLTGYIRIKRSVRKTVRKKKKERVHDPLKEVKVYELEPDEEEILKINPDWSRVNSNNNESLFS